MDQQTTITIIYYLYLLAMNVTASETCTSYLEMGLIDNSACLCWWWWLLNLVMMRQVLCRCNPRQPIGHSCHSRVHQPTPAATFTFTMLTRRASPSIVSLGEVQCAVVLL